MNVKTTIKLGDKIDTFDDANSSFGSNERNLEQLAKFKAYMNVMIMAIEDKDPEMKNKRIEVIMEFEDDGFYLVLGRKPREVTEFGT